MIELFKREQTDLEADGKWNKPNQKQQILALTSMLQSVVKQVNNVSTIENGGKTKTDKKTDDKVKDPKVPPKYVVPDWKWKREDGQTTCTRDGKEYWWCDKHTNPSTGSKGMWARHKPENHTDDFIPGQAKKTGRKKKKPKKEDASSSSTTVTVDKNLLNALKTGADVQSFLDQLQENGTSLN